MGQPIFYQTLNMVGVDPTIYSTAQFTAGASVDPSYPSPPFITGTRAFGSDGSEFIYVQASTSISLSDFVVINTGQAVAPYQANSVTTTNVAASLNCLLASTGIIVKQSVSFIPAQAYFWACTKGQFVPAITSGANLTTTATPVALYTTSTAGQLTSTPATTGGAFAGFTVVNSITVSIAASIVPPVGTLTSTGFTQGPVVSMNNVRTVVPVSSSPFSLLLYW